MFKWLSRGGRAQKPEASASRDPSADALLNIKALGRLPQDLIEGGPTAEPAPGYIEEATEPPAEAWEHEREARRKQEEGES